MSQYGRMNAAAPAGGGGGGRMPSGINPGHGRAAVGVRRGRAVRALLALCAAAVVFLMAGAERAAAQTGGATAVSIPDANLRARLETWLGKASGETITRDDMATLGEGPNRRLTLTNLGIRDLTGLEYAVNVYALFLSGNDISDLTPLGTLTFLQTLDLANNRISDITPLARLVYHLNTLKLNDNLITDLTPLARSFSLRTLEIVDNRISDLSPLADHVRLTHLSASNNRISDLSPLARLTRMEYLHLRRNRITNIDPLQNMQSLTTLSLEGNFSLRKVSALSGLNNLRVLDLEETGVDDISPLVRTPGFMGAWFRQIDLRGAANLVSATALPHIQTLEGRGIRIFHDDPIGLERWLRGLTVTPEVEQLKVAWDPVTRSSAEGYRVFWKSGRAEFFTRSARNQVLTGLGTTTFTIPNLEPGREYGVMVRVNNPNGGASPTVYGIPLAAIGTVEGVTVTPGVESLTVSWRLAEGAADYKVQWKSGDQDWDPEARQARAGGADKTEYAISGLEGGAEYTVRVIPARNEGQPDGEPSAEARGTPLLAAIGTVEGVTVTPGVESLTVSWRLAEGAADYKVQWKSGDQDWDPEARQARAGGADKTEYAISGLEGGAEYTVRVIPARNEGQPDGEPSAEVKGTPRAPGSEPEPELPAVDVTVTVEEPNSLTVSWPEVSGATRYRVQWRRSAAPEFDADDSEWVLAREGADDAGSGPDATYVYVFVIANLEPDVEYTARVTPMIGDRLGDPGEDSGTPVRRAVVSIMGGPEGVVGTAAAAVTEGEVAELTVMLDGPARLPVEVEWTTEDDTAKAGEDYRAMSGSLTFGPGDDRATLRVPTRQDARVEPEETFRVRLTDPTNAALDPDPDAASATVTIADDDTEPARRRALDTVLAGMGRWIAADAVDVIGERFTGRREVEAQTSLGGRTFSLPGTGPQDSARFAPAAAGTRFADGFSHGEEWRIPETESALPALSAESVSGSRFNLPLGMDDGAGGRPGLRVWGQGTAGGFDSSSETGLRVDGDVVGGYVGFDYPMGRDALLGMAVAHGRSDVDYAIDGVTTGAVDMELTSVLPYGRWILRPGLGVWGLLGAGWGDIGLKDEVGKVETDATMRMAAAGVRRDMAAWRDIDVAAKADAFLARLESGAAEGLPKSAGAAQRLRLSLEGSARRAVSPVSSLTPSLEVGGRWDGGDAETGMGLEVGGGLAFEHETLGLAVEARGRALLAHRESLREWGMSLSGTLDPGVAGRGPWMTFAPGWGAEASRMSQMWDDKGVFRAHGGAGEAPAEFLPGRLGMEVGWGLPTLGGRGLVTPWAGLSMAGSEMGGYILGARMRTGSLMSLSLENRQSGTGEYRLMLFGSLHW